MDTLPDYLEPGLDIVFVGINPGAYSSEVGHYFATPRNRFWPAVTKAGLLPRAMSAETDHLALTHGVGFTDVVKRASRSASDLRAADYRKWAPVLKEKLLRFQPLVACFHGVTAYGNYLKYAENGTGRLEPGLQQRTIGRSQVFVVPNPSPANAAFSLDDLVEWYRRLGELLSEIKGAIS